jgi:hypothetical protein
MKRIIKLTESQLKQVIERVINEEKQTPILTKYPCLNNTRNWIGWKHDPKQNIVEDSYMIYYSNGRMYSKQTKTMGSFSCNGNQIKPIWDNARGGGNQQQTNTSSGQKPNYNQFLRKTVNIYTDPQMKKLMKTVNIFGIQPGNTSVGFIERENTEQPFLFYMDGKGLTYNNKPVYNTDFYNSVKKEFDKKMTKNKTGTRVPQADFVSTKTGQQSNVA